MFPDALDPETRRICEALGRESLIQTFYLAGGTAIAFHLGHRLSFDLDFFSLEPYSLEPLLAMLHRTGAVELRQSGSETTIGKVDATQVSFFAYPYPLLSAPSTWRGVRVADLLDLALMKVTAIAQRGRRRDFVDLYAICQSGFSIGELLARIPEKYGELRYPSYHHIRALTFFDDAETDLPLKLLRPIEWATVKHFFEAETRAFLRRI